MLAITAFMSSETCRFQSSKSSMSRVIVIRKSMYLRSFSASYPNLFVSFTRFGGGFLSFVILAFLPLFKVVVDEQPPAEILDRVTEHLHHLLIGMRGAQRTHTHADVRPVEERRVQGLPVHDPLSRNGLHNYLYHVVTIRYRRVPLRVTHRP